MTLLVFVGPTLRREEVEAELDAICLPPVAQGDVFRATREAPRAIGIIDGFFEAVASVWHKEILWAMAEGVQVFGSGSMGALRAAELEPFGMEGIGWIFEAYRSGLLEDDDEVAVTHGPPETGYAALSDAMVNIRRTLERAVEAQVITPETAASMVAIGKRQFYKQRSYEAILEAAAGERLAGAEIAALRVWLPSGAIDQKAEDAREMLRAMARWHVGDPSPKRVAYSFAYTDMWDELVCYHAPAGC